MRPEPEPENRPENRRYYLQRKFFRSISFKRDGASAIRAMSSKLASNLLTKIYQYKSYLEQILRITLIIRSISHIRA